MPTLRWVVGGQSVKTDGAVAEVLEYTHTAQNDDRFFAILKSGDYSWHLSLTVSQMLKLEDVCPSVEKAKELAEAWEQLGVAEEDQTYYKVLVSDANYGQRLSVAKVNLEQIHQGQAVHDVRVSAVGTPAPARGHKHYAVAFKTKRLPTYAGGQQVYPRNP